MYLHFVTKISVVVFLLLQLNSSIAQIKLGNAATQLEKSALLELNGNRQGLLLPRLTDTIVINSLNPPDGMLVYFLPANAGKGLYIRKSGFWQRLTTDSALLNTSINSWNLSGNSALTGAEKFGPLNNVGLNIITNNTSRITITNTGLTTLNGNTVLNGTLSLLPASSATDANALLLNSNNVVVQRPLNSVAFTGAIQSINGLTVSTQTFGAIGTAALGFTSTGSVHTLNIPDADATNRGFVSTGGQTIAGNKTFNNNIVVNGTTKIGAAGTALNSIIKATVASPSFVIPGNKVTSPALGTISQDKTTWIIRTFTVTGATVGASVTVNPSQQMADNSVIAYARVSAPNTVEVKFINTTVPTFVGTTLLGLAVLTTPTSATDITVPAMDFYFTIIQ